MECGFLLENTQGKITCLYNQDNYLYVGTSDGHILLFDVQQQTSASGEVSFRVDELWKRNLNRGKKEVQDIQGDPIYRRLFVQHDNSVEILDMDTLEPITRIKEFKNVSCFALEKSFGGAVSSANELSSASGAKSTPEGPHRIAIALKKKLSICTYKKNEVKQSQELIIPDKVDTMEWFDTSIFVGYKKEYSLLHSKTGEVTDLPQLERVDPLVRLMGNEVLLKYETVGIFVGISGEKRASPTRGSVTWSESPISIGICFPYVACVLSKSIEIFNLYEQNRTGQTISFPYGLHAFTGRRRVFVSTAYRVYVLTPIPTEKMITSMIENHHIFEAFELFDKIFEGPEEEKKLKLKQMEEDSGFANFFAARFPEAFDNFARSNIDIREILAYFPDLNPKHPRRKYVTKRPVRGDIQSCVKDASERKGNVAPGTLDATGADKAAVFEKQAKKRLQKFLEQQRGTLDNTEEQAASDFALLVLYNDNKQTKELEKFLQGDNHIEIEEGREFLENKNLYRYLAFLHKSKGNLQAALDILKRLGEGNLIEQGQNGIAETIEMLSECDDRTIIFKYARWMFEKVSDKSEAVQIFLSKRRARQLPPEPVLQFLAIYPDDDMLIKYLEFLVLNQKNEDPRFHTQLATKYIDTLQFLALESSSHHMPGMASLQPIRVKAGSEAGMRGELRRKLLHHLQASDKFTIGTILNQLKGTNLYEETVILYSKSGEHDEALKVLVWDMQDLKAAEQYCIDNFEKLKNATPPPPSASNAVPSTPRGNDSAPPLPVRMLTFNPLFLNLLKICFYPDEGRPKNTDFGLVILSTHAKEIDTVKAIQLIPDDLTLNSTLMSFLTKAIQTTVHTRRDRSIAKNVAKMENLQIANAHAHITQKHVVITNDTNCRVCGKRIGDSVFAVFPNKVVVHFRCFKSRNVCPVTGTDFSKYPMDVRDL